MLKENYNSPCEFAEQMIAYLYEETSVGEKNKFEAHLKSCANCVDEFANFGSIRSSVHEWREADFDSLSAPHFDIATITGAKPQIVVEIEKPQSRFADFWSNWIFNPAFATAAILILFVGAGMFINSHQFSNENDVAAISNESSGKISTSPTAEKVREELNENRFAEQDKKQENAIDKTSDRSEISAAKQNQSIEKPDVPNQTVKISTKMPKNKSINSQVAVETANSIKQNAPNRRTKAPTLTNNDEDEDDSVRLSDLFAEIDTK